MGRDQTTEEYLLCCGLQVYKIGLSGHWHLWADATFPATSVLQRLTVPTPYTGSLCLDRVSAELLSAQKADPGWVWTLARLLAQGEVCIGALPLIASLEPSALQEPYAFKFP